MLAAAELALLTEPDGRASPGWESLRSSLTVFNLLSLVAAFSSVLGAGVGVFYSFHLARHFGNGGHCFSLTLKAVVLCYNLCVQTIAVGDDHGTVLPPPAPITIALDRAPIWCVTALLLSPPALGVLAALFAGADLKCALAAFFFSYTVHVFHKALARLTKYPAYSVRAAGSYPAAALPAAPRRRRWTAATRTPRGSATRLSLASARSRSPPPSSSARIRARAPAIVSAWAEPRCRSRGPGDTSIPRWVRDPGRRPRGGHSRGTGLGGARAFPTSLCASALAPSWLGPCAAVQSFSHLLRVLL